MLNRNSSRMAEGKSVIQPPWLMAIKTLSSSKSSSLICRVLTDCFSVSISSLWCGRPCFCFVFSFQTHPLTSNTHPSQRVVLDPPASNSYYPSQLVQDSRKDTRLIGADGCINKCYQMSHIENIELACWGNSLRQDVDFANQAIL